MYTREQVAVAGSILAAKYALQENGNFVENLLKVLDEQSELDELLATPVDGMAHDALLKAAGIQTLGDFRWFSLGALEELNNVGPIRAAKIVVQLAEANFPVELLGTREPERHELDRATSDLVKYLPAPATLFRFGIHSLAELLKPDLDRSRMHMGLGAASVGRLDALIERLHTAYERSNNSLNETTSAWDHS
jgi:hypothetical protein